jgi:hypothetical protein
MSESNKTTDNAPNRWISIDINGKLIFNGSEDFRQDGANIETSANSKTEKVNQKGM